MQIRNAANGWRTKCRMSGEKSMKWFREYASLAADMADELPHDRTDLIKPLRALERKVKDVREVMPPSLSKPFWGLLDGLKANDELRTTALLEHFDKLKELVYRRVDNSRVQAETDTSVPSQDTTVPEFGRKLEPEEIEEIEAAKDWAEGLTVPRDLESLNKILSMSTQDMLLYLKDEGYGVRELSRILEIPPSTISVVIRGTSEPKESVAKRVRHFLLFRQN